MSTLSVLYETSGWKCPTWLRTLLSKNFRVSYCSTQNYRSPEAACSEGKSKSQVLEKLRKWRESHGLWLQGDKSQTKGIACLCYSFLLFACTCMCACMHTLACGCVCKDQRSMSGVFHDLSPPYFFNPKLTVFLDYLAIKSQGLSCLHFTVLGLWIFTLPHLTLFYFLFLT